jgi:hypothetical protein
MSLFFYCNFVKNHWCMDLIKCPQKGRAIAKLEEGCSLRPVTADLNVSHMLSLDAHCLGHQCGS